MKTVFLLFLLLNATYFYFQSGEDEGATTSNLLTQPKLPAGAKPLVLLRERGLGSEAAKSVAKKKPPVAQVPPRVVVAKAAKESPAKPTTKRVETKAPPKPKSQKSAADVCFTFGPLAKSETADKATKKANSLGVRVERRNVSKRTPKGYWVYLEPSKSYKAAKRKVAEMQKRGLKDLFIMGKGSRKNAISLGLFKSKKAAEDRFKQVKNMGLKAAFETQYRLSEQTWLDMTVAGDQTSAVAALSEMPEDYLGANLTQRKCQ